MKENVILWTGAGQIGMAIARRMGCGMKNVVGDKSLVNAQAIAKTMTTRASTQSPWRWICPAASLFWR